MSTTTNVVRDAIVHRAMFRFRLALAAHNGAERRGEDAEQHVEPVLRALNYLRMLGIDVEPLVEAVIAQEPLPVDVVLARNGATRLPGLDATMPAPSNIERNAITSSAT